MSGGMSVRGETLAGIGYFGNLSPDARKAIARRFRTRRHAAGHQIVRQGDTPDEVCFVVSGSVRVAHYSPNGRETAFRVLGPGECFGDLGVIDGEERSADVIAVEAVHIVSLSGRDFLALLERHPDVAWSALQRLSGLVRQLSDRVVEFSTLSADRRVSAELLRLARTRGREESGAVHIDAPPTHADIAARLSTQREAVTRALGRLKRAGAIRCERASWTIVDVDLVARNASIERAGQE